ncbi:MAG TPA: nucleotide disphospho-sugar-binding domain-containing protein [Solirubrobacteraceae bacterium]|nr:nucleotide disphospho-sugar-binding domain-containing protein [Solirubrobacteraceae bacterium]
MARIGVVESGFYSHIGAIKRVGRALERQGHCMVPLAPNDATDLPFSEQAHNHSPALERTSQRAPIAAGLAEIAERYSEELIEALVVSQLDLVIHDVMAPWGRVAADFCGVPRIVSNPLFLRRVPRRWGVLPRRHMKSGHPITVLGERARGTADDADAPEQVSDYERRVEAARLAIARRWKVELGHSQDVLFSPGDTIVSLNTERIIGGRMRGGTWHFVGPLLDPPQLRHPARDRPLVYVCYGSSFNNDAEPYRAAIDGLADENVEVLVSLGGGSLTATDLGPLPSNAEVHDFAWSEEALARSSAYLTHGGSNSVHESLLAGVPMLLLPQGADQFAVSRRIARLGAGRIVEPSPAAIRAGVRWLLDNGRPRERAQQLGKHLADFDGETRLAKVVERKLAAHTAASPGAAEIGTAGYCPGQ